MMHLSDKIDYQQGQLPINLSAEEYYDAAMYLLAGQDHNEDRYVEPLFENPFGDSLREGDKDGFDTDEEYDEARRKEVERALACLFFWYQKQFDK